MRFSVSKTNIMLTSKLKHISVIVGNLAKWASKLWRSQENLYHHSRIKTVWWKVIQIIDEVFTMLFHPFSLLSLSYFYTDLCLQDIHVEYSVLICIENNLYVLWICLFNSLIYKFIICILFYDCIKGRTIRFVLMKLLYVS